MSLQGIQIATRLLPMTTLGLLKCRRSTQQGSDVAQYCNSRPADLLGRMSTSAAVHWRHWEEGSKERAARWNKQGADLVGAANYTGYIASDCHFRSFGSCNHLFNAFQALLNAAIGVSLAELL